MPNQPDPQPQDPFGAMSAAAVATHEVFISYVNAGFTREEAMQIIKTFIISTIQGGASGTANQPE